MGIIRVPERASVSNALLQCYFGWAGGTFPFDNGAADVTISNNTTWNDAEGYKRVGVLTINAARTLKIERSPFVIFAKEIVFGGVDSIIDGNGASGTSSGTHLGTYSAAGGTVDGTPRAQGGCGGIFLIILTSKISGAAGVIRANGGIGWRGTQNNASNYGASGQGAFSGTTVAGTGISGESFFGNKDAGHLLASGGGTYPGSGGGGGGVGSVGDPGGGSGIGGGAGLAHSTHYGANGRAARSNLNISGLLYLYSLGCLGGGGGGAAVFTTGTQNGAGGGGGGAVLVFTKEALVTPTLQANGGIGVCLVGGENGDGGAGITRLVMV